jgi:hypothetical protein
MKTPRWRGQILLTSAVMTSCSLVCEHHYTEEDTALNSGSYDTTYANLCAPTFQRNKMAQYSMDMTQYIISRGLG